MNLAALFAFVSLALTVNLLNRTVPIIVCMDNLTGLYSVFDVFEV